MRTVVEWALALSLLGNSPEVDNPEYGWWSSFAPGAWVKLRIVGQIESHPFTLEQTHTLLEVHPDRVIVSRKGTMKIEDREVPANKDRDEIQRKDEQALKIDREGDEETLLPGGRTLCHWIEAHDPRTGATVTFWLAKGIPGGVAKGEIRPQDGSSASRISLVAWGSK